MALVWYALRPILPPIRLFTFQCCALLKLAVCAVSLSICIMGSALSKLMVLILCGLSVCAPGCFTPYSFLFSLLRVLWYRFLAHFYHLAKITACHHHRDQ